MKNKNGLINMKKTIIRLKETIKELVILVRSRLLNSTPQKTQ